MKKKKKIMYMIIGVVLLLIVVIGGKKYMDYKKEKDRKAEQAQLVDAKKEVALYIVQNYEGVKKIQFGDFDENKMTGYWSVPAKINNTNKILITTKNITNVSENISEKTNPKTFILKEKEDENASLKNIIIEYEGAYE